MFNFKGFNFTVDYNVFYTSATTDLGGHYELKNSVDVEEVYVVNAPKRSHYRLYPIKDFNSGSKFRVGHLHEPLSNGQRILLDKIGQELCQM
jgi:hypothetical protein